MMKQLIPLCFTLFFVSIIISNSAAVEAADAVVDVDGEELQVGASYYVVSNIIGAAGLSLSIYGSLTPFTLPCPYTVIELPSEAGWFGIPVTLHPTDEAEGAIRVSSPLNIQFAITVPCANSSVWRIGNLDAGTRSRMIQLGGEKGPCDKSGNCFTIEGARGVYKFVSIPENLNIAVISAINWERLVVLTCSNNAFNFVFIKADRVRGHPAYNAVK